ncbi:MAG: DUF1592 domain-containing protein [Gemmatimonadota bacterium]|nr:DUF1592 domain-containing protein [Gemmatimonadota bacterium]MDE2985955.1 DUF1592 domain-containing protein [Gemmatimonadota bacterium]
MSRYAVVLLVAGAFGIGIAGRETPGSYPVPLAAVPRTLPQKSIATPDFATLGPNEIVEKYCVRCHNERRRIQNLVLEGFDIADAAQRRPTIEKMIRKLRAGMMPPQGMPRPEPEVLAEMATELENTMDRIAAGDPNPGRRTFQRLNRAEYAAAVRDLLGLDVDVATFLPLDTKSANFDNIADVQMPSATVMEGYLRAAGQVSRLALGDPEAEISSTEYRIPRVQSQKDRVEGAPAGTRGGLSVLHNFPADGKYVFHIMPYNAVEGEVFGRTFGTEQIEVSIDGARVALLTVDRWMSESEPTGLNIRTDSIYVTAGQKRVTAAFIRQFEGVVDDLIRPIDHTLADGQIGIGYGVTTQQHLQRLTVLGPFDVTGVSDTPARRAVFICRPTLPEEALPCARRIIDRVATRAYRRPATESDIDGLLPFYEMGAADGGFEKGIRTALQAILASPHFVFRIERTPAGADPGGIYEIAGADLASRLSFFLWGAPPDDELLKLARAGALSDPAELTRQARRLLADPRAEALATRFAAQWLRLQDLEKIHPDALTYPYFDQTLADAMHRETELFFHNLVEEDRSVLEMLTADYTFVNERLARHYGITGVTGPAFKKVDYPDEHRRGLLGHGSILTLTSHPDRTSAVLRGKWVLEVLLGTPPPPPPPDIPAFEETAAAEEGRFLTVRERLEEHSRDPRCRSCHIVMDPLGLALENFDVTGVWRIRDGGNPVDPVGEMYNGRELKGPGDLRDALLAIPDVVLSTFTENLLAFALGRRVEYYDMPTVRAIIREATANDHRMSSFVLGVVGSDAFRMARAGTPVAEEDPGHDPQREGN